MKAGLLTPKLVPATGHVDTPVIAELRGVSKTYKVGNDQELKVLDNIDLLIQEGELLALLGQSGSGK